MQEKVTKTAGIYILCLALGWAALGWFLPWDWFLTDQRVWSLLLLFPAVGLVLKYLFSCLYPKLVSEHSTDLLKDILWPYFIFSVVGYAVVGWFMSWEWFVGSWWFWTLLLIFPALGGVVVYLLSYVVALIVTKDDDAGVYGTTEYFEEVERRRKNRSRWWRLKR